MDPLRIVWGTINNSGDILESSEEFNVFRDLAPGVYRIAFQSPFSLLPALTGSQVLWQSDDQSTLDNVVFPFVRPDGFTAITGNAFGKHEDRSFSFIAVGI